MDGVEAQTSQEAVAQTTELDFTERQLIEAIAERAQAEGWEVERQPTVGVMRPDLAITPKAGMMLVIEVKREVGLIHFASLGQVSNYRRGLAELTGAAVYPVLVTTGEESEEIAALARELCVHLIFARGDQLGAVADAALERIERLIPALEREPREHHRSSEDAEGILRSLFELLEHGESREEIAETLEMGFRELAGHYTTLLTKLEATDPERLDTIMNAWSEHAE